MRLNANKINSFDEKFGKIDLNPISLVRKFTFQFPPNQAESFIFSANTTFRDPNINDIINFRSLDFGFLWKALHKLHNNSSLNTIPSDAERKIIFKIKGVENSLISMFRTI